MSPIHEIGTDATPSSSYETVFTCFDTAGIVAYSHTRYPSSQWIPNALQHRRSVASFNSGQAPSFGPSICLMDTLQPVWDRKSNRDLIQVLKVNIKRLVPEEAKDTRCPGAGIASGYDLPW